MLKCEICGTTKEVTFYEGYGVAFILCRGCEKTSAYLKKMKEINDKFSQDMTDFIEAYIEKEIPEDSVVETPEDIKESYDKLLKLGIVPPSVEFVKCAKCSSVFNSSNLKSICIERVNVYFCDKCLQIDETTSYQDVVNINKELIKIAVIEFKLKNE